MQMNNTKKCLKTSNGITLIALVITIIVLLILAGISISMLAGDNSILQKATTAKTSSERAEAKEQAQIDIMAWITDKIANHQDASLDDAKVKGILTGQSYVKTANDTSFITAKGEYVIPYSELYQSSNVTPSEPETPTDKSTIILGALENANYFTDVWFKSNIRISDTSTAMFYDDNLYGTAYIEYNGAIYKITYTGNQWNRDGRITNVELTNIDISTLSVSNHNLNTIVSRNARYSETKEVNGNIYYLYWDEPAQQDYWYNSAGVFIDVSDHFTTNW